MYFTELGLTQYEPHDKFNPLENYNRDMQIITNTVTVASGRVSTVEQESKDRDADLKDQLDGLSAIVDVTTTSISNMILKEEELENAIKANKQDIEDLQGTLADDMATLAEHITTSTSFSAGILAEVKANKTETDGKINADRERLAVVETAATQNREEIEKLKEADNSDKEDITELTNRVTNLENVDSQTADTLNRLRDDVNDISSSAAAAKTIATNAEAIANNANVTAEEALGKKPTVLLKHKEKIEFSTTGFDSTEIRFGNSVYGNIGSGDSEILERSSNPAGESFYNFVVKYRNFDNPPESGSKKLCYPTIAETLGYLKVTGDEGTLYQLDVTLLLYIESDMEIANSQIFQKFSAIAGNNGIVNIRPLSNGQIDPVTLYTNIGTVGGKLDGEMGISIRVTVRAMRME